MDKIELIQIASALNQNIIKNKDRDRDHKISTDEFIMSKFNISRKKFSKLIIDTGIKYNKTTHMYDVPADAEINDNKLSVIISKKTNNSRSNNKESNDDKLSVITVEKVKKVIEKEYPEILKIIELYKKNKVDLNREESKKIDINRPELQGELFSKSFKTYKDILNDFVNFCSGRVEKQKDLVAIALLEFMEKYR